MTLSNIKKNVQPAHVTVEAHTAVITQVVQ